MKRMILLLLMLILCSSPLASQTKSQIINNTMESVVRIHTFDLPDFGYQSGYSTGTGYAVGKDGIVLTNYHVIEDAKGIVVYSPSTEPKKAYYAVPLLTDSVLDIAVLKVFGLEAKPLEFADSNEVLQGDEILIMGYPGASYQNDKLKVSWGIISSDNLDTLIQTTAAINSGNSGGPAINLQGKVAGTVLAKIVGLTVENIGLLVNNKFTLNVMKNVDYSSVRLKSYYGTDNQEAYKKYCAAEILRLSSEYIDSLDSYITVLDSSIILMKEAIDLDPGFTQANYYLASYYLQESLIHCFLNKSENSKKSNSDYRKTITNCMDWATKNKDKNEFTNLMYEVSQGEDIDCEDWHDKFFEIFESLSFKEIRIEEFNEYISTGKPPTMLKRALNNSVGSFLNGKGSRNSRLFGVPLSIGLSSTINFVTISAFKVLETSIEPWKQFRLMLGIMVKDKLVKEEKAEKITAQIGASYDIVSLRYAFSEVPGAFNYRLDVVSDLSGSIDNPSFIYGFGIGSFNTPYLKAKAIKIKPNIYKYIIVPACEKEFGVYAVLSKKLFWRFWVNLEISTPFSSGDMDKATCMQLGLKVDL